MNKDILNGKWKQLKGSVKEKWGRLTDDELDQIDGEYDQLVGSIQEHYGKSLDQAREEVNEYMSSYD